MRTRTLRSEHFDEYVDFAGGMGWDPYSEDSVDTYIDYKGLSPNEAEDLHRDVGLMFTMAGPPSARGRR